METILTTLAVLLRILSNPVGNVFQKQLTATGNPPLQVNFITYLLLSLLCVVPAFAVDWATLPHAFWWYAILGGIAGATGNGLLVKALENGDLSVLGPINAYKSVVGLLVGLLILGEVPNLWGLVGVLLIIYGSYFVLDTTEERFTWALLKRREIQYRIGALVLTAIEAVFVKKQIVLSSTTTAFYSWCFFGAVFSFVLFLPANKSRSRLTKKLVVRYAMLVLCIGTMQYSTNYAFAHMPVGYALSLFQLSTIVSVLLGHRLFNEQHIGKKLVGAAIMLIGSVVIILFKNA